MNVILFISVLVVSFVVVRIGAIAFHLTGLEWSVAKFQALSCFTSTGFTTREAELITATPRRRRIASILIILGHAGLITMIATFANSLRPAEIEIPLIHRFIPAVALPYINLAIIVAAIYITYRVFTSTRFARKLTGALRQRMINRQLVRPVSFEELTVATGGYGVSRIQVCKNSPVLEKTLQDSQLRPLGITILAIVRSGETMAGPPANTRIELGDELICFGRLDDIREKLCPAGNGR